MNSYAYKTLVIVSSTIQSFTGFNHLNIQIMDIFIIVRKYFAYNGVLLLSGTNSELIRVLLAILALVVKTYSMLTTGWYFLLEAQTIQEYSESLPMVDAFGFILSEFCLFLCGRTRMLKLMQSLQLLMTRRASQSPASQAIYQKANDQVEWASHKAEILLFRFVVPFYLVPPMMQSYIDYYVRHRTAERAFKLPIPAT